MTPDIYLVIIAAISFGLLMGIVYVLLAWKHQPTCRICGDAVPYERKFCGDDCYKQWLLNNKKENAAG